MKARYAFAKACNTAVKDLAKAAGWKRYDYFLFREAESYFFKARLNVHVNASRSVATLEAKPMALDPIVWDIFGLEDNRRLPLSFRGSGAFVSSALTFHEQEAELEGDEPLQVATRFLEIAEASSARALELLKSRPYSELVQEDPNQIAHGSYSVACLASLIHEGRLAEAEAMAEKFATGRLPASDDFSKFDGQTFQSFHQMAVDWLKSGRRDH